MNRMSICVCVVCAVFVASGGRAAAQGEDLAVLSKKVIDASPGQDITPSLESARALYLKDNDYNGFVDFLNSLAKKKKGFAPQLDYYTALARYQQLKFLEERQLWDEYFSRGNEYREAIVERAGGAREEAGAEDPVRVKAQALLWQFHQFQQDAFVEQSLGDLIKDVDAYAQAGKDPLVLKDVADILAQAEERAQAKRVYDLYIRRLASSGLSEPQYAQTAKRFYEDGNLELAQSMYDVYVEKIVAAGKDDPAGTSSALIAIATQFAYSPDKLSDPAYAESVFAQAAQLRALETWEEPVMRARAYNLEKMKEFAAARRLYQLLLETYPSSGAASETRYRSGLIAAFALGDIAQARSDFKAVIDQNAPNSFLVPASEYQLGVLAQWEQDVKAAQAFYAKAQAHAALDKDTAGLITTRLGELKDGKPLEDNLKTFLDITFGPDRIMYTMQKASLVCDPAALSQNLRVGVRSQAHIGSTGCFAVGLEYLWSGTLGDAFPGPGEDSFSAAYVSPGIKDIKLVVVSPTGIVDRAFDIVDVK